MGIFRIVAVALVAVSLIVLLRSYKPELALQLSIASGVLLLIMILDELTSVVDIINSLIAGYGLDSGVFKVVIKVIGIAYVAQFASQICNDAGESAVSGKVELAGRLLIITVSMPAVLMILDMISALLYGQ